MNHPEIISRIRQSKIIAILRKIPYQQALSYADAVIRGGIGVLEVTMDGESAIQLIEQLRHTYGEQILLGAGTVMTADQLRAAMRAQVELLFSPHLDVTLVEAASRAGGLMIPGVTTPTEIAQATRAGARVLKLFPANSLGPGYVKNLLGPFKGAYIIPTGGITPENAWAYFRAGALAVGMGTALISKEHFAEENWAAVQEQVQAALKSLENNRG